MIDRYAFGMTTVIEPDAFMWSNAGAHVGETLHDIVKRKQTDIENFGYCLWAYGGRGPGHPEKLRTLARQYTTDERLPVLMQSSGKSGPVGGALSYYQVDRGDPRVRLPEGMTPVTGADKAWAFYLTELEWATDVKVDVAGYSAVLTTKGREDLASYLKGSHGKALAARALSQETGRRRDVRRVDVIGITEYPYGVFLLDS